MPATVYVEGGDALARTFKAMGPEVRRDFAKEIRRVAEPVRGTAERHAQDIKNIGSTWGRIKAGASGATAYVAPASRRRGGSPRGNLGILLFKAMSGALDDERPKVIEGLEDMLDRLAARYEF